MSTESTPPQNTTPNVTPSEDWRVKDIALVRDFIILVTFNDGTSGEVDLQALIHGDSAGVFAELKDPEVFSKVFVHHGVVTWPNEIDLAPDVMYDEIKQHGHWSPSR